MLAIAIVFLMNKILTVNQRVAGSSPAAGAEKTSEVLGFLIL